MTPTYYYIETPEGLSMTVIGGPLIADGDHVWLTTPDGRPLLRLPREHVRLSSREATAQRLMADARAKKAHCN